MKTRAAERKEAWRFKLECLVSLRQLKQKCFVIIIQRVYPLSNSNHNGCSKQRLCSVLTTAWSLTWMLGGGCCGLSAAPRIEFRSLLKSFVARLGEVPRYTIKKRSFKIIQMNSIWMHCMETLPAVTMATCPLYFRFCRVWSDITVSHISCHCSFDRRSQCHENRRTWGGIKCPHTEGWT